MKTIRSDRFKDELKAIVTFIAKDKRSAAKKFNRDLQTIIESLIDNPRKGRMTKNESRELVYKGYTIPYIIEEDDIVILGIFNQNEWKQ
ncbi:MAG: type II toxin-antitoxin system RelE/ParE family toxin [Sulfuricurvum sp.]|uniref:type II toxin-antitoxin system RelE/ParE family toxin n=1 Tax=Sulfuricurvum sp. TaxID=2025608 RepID=UPI002615DEBA|nr:type II toxin-antitoxin system RelE/ParE family toxin [Sulfuricurvum sp.]MDD2369198.1 type II toxin-antitoxin system RelE/ParE family toxin [Sulfuricurvum sp.]MDD2951513.1 type II toxin-antitoxin system RelE/ParE family toxin [Sulfuricurvum sp.]MDD5118056.1 type II toxin-antitoxin system RelE/ParE family toxin [Sulfuricurvum sp.]